MSGLTTATKIRNLAAETIHLLSLREPMLDENTIKELIDKQVAIVALAGRLDARPTPSKKKFVPTGSTP